MTKRLNKDTPVGEIRYDKIPSEMEKGKEKIKVTTKDSKGTEKLVGRVQALSVPKKDEQEIVRRKSLSKIDDDRDFLEANMGTLESMLTKAEMRKFRAQYNKMMEQFKQDVLFSEEIQVYHVILCEILMDRCLIEMKKMDSERRRIEKVRDQLIEAQASGEENEEEIFRIMGQLDTIRSSAKSRSDEYHKYFTQSQGMLGMLKATREQRIKTLEGKNESFIDVIKKLQKADNLIAESVELSTYKVAMMKELIRLSMPHTFMDGSVSEPILSAETLKIQDKVYELRQEMQEDQEPG